MKYVLRHIHEKNNAYGFFINSVLRVSGAYGRPVYMVTVRNNMCTDDGPV